MTALIEGTLDYDENNDCLMVADGVHWYPVVWPAGTEPSADPVGVVLPSGRLVPKATT